MPLMLRPQLVLNVQKVMPAQLRPVLQSLVQMDSEQQQEQLLVPRVLQGKPVQRDPM
jgi:hypothetical protein